MLIRITIIIALVAAAYAAMVPAPFKTLDDRISIVENPALRSSKNIPEIFKQGFFRDQSYYRPLVNLSFMAEYHLFGLNSFYYNLDNLILHAANAVLVFLLVSLLLGQPSIGFWTGVLFAIHPAHWEAVCNIPGRAIILCAFFSLAAFLFFLLWEKRKKAFFIVLSLLSFALALLSKESGGILPGVLALYLWGKADKPLRQKIAVLVPYACVIVAYLLWRHYIGITSVFRSNDLQVFILGFLTFLRSVITHLRILLMPVDLYFDRGLVFFNSFAQWQVGITILFWGAVMAGLAQWHRRITPVILFLIAWFALELLPVSQLVTSIGVQPGMISIANHFLYMPSIPFFIALVLGVGWLYEKNSRLKTVTPSIFRIAVGGILMSLFLLAISQSLYARDEMSMLKRSLSFEPNNARLQASIGLLYVFKDDKATAEKHFQKAVDVEPFNARYRVLLGTSLCEQGRWIECMGQYVALDQPGEINEALERQKKLTIMHINADIQQGKNYDAKGWFIIGVYYAKSGEMQEAIDAFNKTVSMHPGHASALMNLASLYQARQDWTKAKEAYIQLLQNPDATQFQREFSQQHLAEMAGR